MLVRLNKRVPYLYLSLIYNHTFWRSFARGTLFGISVSHRNLCTLLTSPKAFMTNSCKTSEEIDSATSWSIHSASDNDGIPRLLEFNFAPPDAELKVKRQHTCIDNWSAQHCCYFFSSRWSRIINLWIWLANCSSLDIRPSTSQLWTNFGNFSNCLL